MPLSIPTARDIERRIVLRLTGQALPLTDLTPISVVRILIRAMVVEEISALWRGLAESLRDWFIDSARGPALDRRLADFGIARPGALPATGIVLFTVSAPTHVQSGTIVRTAPDAGGATKRYRVRTNTAPTAADLGDGSWSVVSVREVEVEALDLGEAGNTAAGTIVEAETTVQNLESLANPTPLVNGRNALSDSEYREWFVGWLRSLSGTTRGAVLHGVREFVDPVSGRRVQSAALQEWGGTALIGSGGQPVAMRVFVDEGLGSSVPGAPTAHHALVAAVQRLVDGEDTQASPGIRAAGVPVIVEAARSRLVDVELRVDVDGRYDTNAVVRDVRDAISSYVARLPVGGQTILGELQGQLSFSRLFRIAVDVPGVLRVEFARPRADIPVPVGMKLFVRHLVVHAATVS